MMLAAGAVFFVLGLASGVLLALAPFGVLPAEPGIVAWVMFPGLTIVGWLMVVFAARDASIPLINRLAGALLVALAVGATVGLFLVGNSLVQAAGATLSLWYVLAVGFVLGIGGIAFRRPRHRLTCAPRGAPPHRAMHDALLEHVLFLGWAIAVALAGAVLAYREARRRSAPHRGSAVRRARRDPALGAYRLRRARRRGDRAEGGRGERPGAARAARGAVDLRALRHVRAVALARACRSGEIRLAARQPRVGGAGAADHAAAYCPSVARSTSTPSPGRDGISTQPSTCSIGWVISSLRNGCDDRSYSSTGSWAYSE